MEILHIFSVTGNKNRKIWQEMGVGAEKMPPAAGRGRFLTLRGVGDAAPLQGKALGLLFSINLLTL
jgi:hypothetical protein